MLEGGSDDDLGPTQARFAGTYPPHYRPTDTKASNLNDCDELRLGRLTLARSARPDTHGSPFYYQSNAVRTLLFSGDTASWGGLIQPSKHTNFRNQRVSPRSPRLCRAYRSTVFFRDMGSGRWEMAGSYR